jgi:hypothetical protein
MKTYIVLGWLGLMATAAYAMFHVSFEVERLELRLVALDQKIAAEREALHVLRAEWSFLNRPDRLAKLSDELLPHLRPPAAKQIRPVDQLPKNTDAVTAAVAQR